MELIEMTGLATIFMAYYVKHADFDNHKLSNKVTNTGNDKTSKIIPYMCQLEAQINSLHKGLHCESVGVVHNHWATRKAEYKRLNSNLHLSVTGPQSDQSESPLLQPESATKQLYITYYRSLATFRLLPTYTHLCSTQTSNSNSVAALTTYYCIHHHCHLL